MKFTVNFTTGISLTYDIIDEPIGREWATHIAKRNIDECCKINHFNGYASDEMIQDKIIRLYELADYINTFVPSRIIKQEINKSNWKLALHEMHIHFPEMKNDEQYSDVWDSLTEYNDTIHWLESMLMTIWIDDPIESMFRLTLDFNKNVFEFYPIPDESFKHFSPLLQFGGLFLHYTHVGKHAYEMIKVNDLVCPSEQFMPQRTFNASCRLVFNDYLYPDDSSKQHFLDQWTEFYNDKGGLEYWGYDIDDPKIAFGFLKIGELIDISKNNVSINFPKTKEELHSFRKELVNTQVINWEIK
jgi:hypothetical protein